MIGKIKMSQKSHYILLKPHSSIVTSEAFRITLEIMSQLVQGDSLQNAFLELF